MARGKHAPRRRATRAIAPPSPRPRGARDQAAMRNVTFHLLFQELLDTALPKGMTFSHPACLALQEGASTWYGHVRETEST